MRNQSGRRVPRTGTIPRLREQLRPPAVSSVPERYATRRLTDRDGRRAGTTQELEMGRGHARVEIARGFELRDGRRAVALQLIDHAQLVVRHRLIGDQFYHFLELSERLVGLILFLVYEAQVEPGMGQFRVALLDPLQLGCSSLDIAQPQEGQPVIQLFAHGIRRQGEGLPQFLDGLFVSGGVFVKRLAQIPVLPDQGVVRILAENQPACAGHTGQHGRPHKPAKFAAHLPDSMQYLDFSDAQASDAQE